MAVLGRVGSDPRAGPEGQHVAASPRSPACSEPEHAHRRRARAGEDGGVTSDRRALTRGVDPRLHGGVESDLARLAGYYLLSWGYLLVFGLIGMVAVTLARHRSLGLLSAMGAWLVITFVIPQFTSALRPSASLNPITDPVGTSQAFFRATAHGRSYSIAEQYKDASAHILATANATETAWHTAVRIAPIAGAAALLTLALVVLVQRHDYSRSASND